MHFQYQLIYNYVNFKKESNTNFTPKSKKSTFKKRKLYILSAFFNVFHFYE